MTIRLVIDLPDHLEDDANDAIERDVVFTFLRENEPLIEDVRLEV